jgi:nucleotide-binding universal stress UspA family protein
LFKRILVVLDPARDLGPARRFALAMIKRWNPSVVAFYTAFEEAMPFKAASSEGVKPQMFVGKNIQEQFCKEVEEEIGSDVEVTKVIEEGPYEVTIPTAAAREEADLVVLGSFHAKMERRIVGSDTERVIEYSPCSVLLVRDPKKLPAKSAVLAFAHDSPNITPMAIAGLSLLAKDLNAVVHPIVGVPPKLLDDAKTTFDELVANLRGAEIETGQPQVLTSRWILGPHGVVHRAVSGLHPNIVVISRFKGLTEGNASHWLVHEFVADTPGPVLFLK